MSRHHGSGANRVHGNDAGCRCLTSSDVRLQMVIEAWNELGEQVRLAFLELIESQRARRMKRSNPAIE